MRYIEVGGVRVSALGLWLPSLQAGEGETRRAASRYFSRDYEGTLRDALSLGMNLIQLSNFPDRYYRPPLAKAIRGFVATPMPLLFRQRQMRRWAERLGRDAIVVVQTGGSRREIAAMRQLLDAGLVGYVEGFYLSVDKWQHAERALGWPVLFNLANFDPFKGAPGRDLVAYARDAGRIIIAHPFGWSKYHGIVYRGKSSPWEDGLWRDEGPWKRELRAAIQGIARDHGTTPDRILFAWLTRFPVVALTLSPDAAAVDLELSDSEHSTLTELIGHK